MKTPSPHPVRGEQGSRPIIFSAPMIRALLDGRKTMTRRLLKPQPWRDVVRVDETDGNSIPMQPGSWCSHKANGDISDSLVFWWKCPYGGPGDTIWVREAWCIGGNPDRVCYRATEGSDADCWRSPIHMPRAMSRLTLEIESVRVERVQSISEDDAAAEGVETDVIDQAYSARDYSGPDRWFIHWGTLTPEDGYVDLDVIHRTSYRTLWESIHGPGSWESNAWTWVLGFRVAARAAGPEVRK